MKWVLVLMASMWLCAALPKADAQVVQSYSAGYPIWFGAVQVPAGATYEFRTDFTIVGAGNATYGDTILTLWDPDTSTTLEGADGCILPSGSFTWGPSCFEWTNNSTSDKWVWLIGRAWRSSSPATTRLYAYPAGGSPIEIDDFFGNAGPFDIGGGVQENVFADTNRHYWSTTHQPGNAGYHLLLAYNRFSHSIRHIGLSNSQITPGLADLDTNEVSLFNGVDLVFGGWSTPYAGPLRLVQNDWFGSDTDDDGLNAILEADLGTCDNPTDILPNGETCLERFPECIDVESPTCLAQLRDTDHDGLRDDIEVFGYYDSLARMALYGADPLHKDVFVEMHTMDRVPATTDCDAFAASGILERDPRFMGGETIGQNFFNNVAQIYDQADLPGIDIDMNPDGDPGIRFHYDVGTPNPDPSDTAWGDWGGGNTCYATSANYATDCVTDQHPDRSWLFRFGIDTASGGQTSSNRHCFTAGSTIVHVHEVGHLLGLDHGGPDYTAGAGDNGANRRPSYPSRISYRFQNVSGPSWTNIGFSSGAVPGAHSARFAQEVDPFPAATPATIESLREGDPEVPVCGTGPNDAPCITAPSRDVDWNLDGNIDSDPTIWGEYRGLENAVNAREQAGRGTDADLRTAMYGSHMDAAIVGDALVFAYVKYSDGPGTGNIMLKANTDGECDLIATQAGDNTTYGPCVALGTAHSTGITADAVSLSRTLLPAQSGGGTEEGLLVVWRNGSSLYWLTYYVTPTSNPQQASYALHWWGSLSGFGVDADDGIEATLVEVPASATNPHGGVLMIYADAGGVVRQGFLPPAATSWQGPFAATAAGGSVGLAAGDIGAVAYDGEVFLAGRVSVFQVSLYTLPAGANANTPWVYRTAVQGTTGGFGVPSTYADTELAVTPAPTGDDPASVELHVFLRDIENELRHTYTNDIASFATSAWTALDDAAIEEDEESQMVAVAVYDDRPVAAGAHGLRSFRSTSRRCDELSSCGSPGWSPGAPPDLTCGTEHCYSWGLDCNASADCFSPTCTTQSDCGVGPCMFGVCRDEGKWPSHIAYSPFREGHHPTNYCDYNDWVQMRWAGCQYLARRPAPTGTDPAGFVSTPYQLTSMADDENNVRCDIRPLHPEPNGSGGCVIMMPVGNMTEADRFLHPDAYGPPGVEVTCGF